MVINLFVASASLSMLLPTDISLSIVYVAYLCVDFVKELGLSKVPGRQAGISMMTQSRHLDSYLYNSMKAAQYVTVYFEYLT